MGACGSNNKNKEYKVGSHFPDIRGASQLGEIDTYRYMEDGWLVFFSHPTREVTSNPMNPNYHVAKLGETAKLISDFERRKTKLIAVAISSKEKLESYLGEVEKTTGQKVGFPVITDPEGRICKKLKITPDLTSGAKDGKKIYIIGPDKKIREIVTTIEGPSYHFDSLLRSLDLIQISQKKEVSGRI